MGVSHSYFLSSVIMNSWWKKWHQIFFSNCSFEMLECSFSINLNTLQETVSSSPLPHCFQSLIMLFPIKHKNKQTAKHVLNFAWSADFYFMWILFSAKSKYKMRKIYSPLNFALYGIKMHCTWCCTWFHCGLWLNSYDYCTAQIFVGYNIIY